MSVLYVKLCPVYAQCDLVQCEVFADTDTSNDDALPTPPNGNTLTHIATRPMKNLAMEWGPYGIRTNTVCPGPIAGTEGMDRLGPPPGDPLFDRLVSTIPAGRYGEKDEVANAAVFLASPLATYISGTVLKVDGGQSLPGMGAFTGIMGQYMAKQAAKK